MAQQPLMIKRCASVAADDPSLFVDKGPITMYHVAVRGYSFPEPTKAIRRERIVGIEPQNPVSSGALDGSIDRFRLSRIRLANEAKPRVSAAANDRHGFVL
jgi:hypothetical protein